MDQQSPDDLQAALAQDRAQVIASNRDSVSRETFARLDAYVALLLERQARMNLIARSTIPTLWSRHIADCLQLLGLAPNARLWADLGSGAGFPGLVLACSLAEIRDSHVHLVESTQKKATFLRDCVEALKLPAIVHAQRIEDFACSNKVKFDVVTARALAPLERLLQLVNPLLKRGAVGLFPKGQDVAAELTQASKSWKIEAELIPSRTDPHGRIVVVHHASKR